MRHKTRAARGWAATTAVACGIAIAACNDASAPGAASRRGDRHVGVLQLQGAPAPFGAGDNAHSDSVQWSDPPSAGIIVPPRVIEVPDTVQAGRPVEIVVHTVLPGGCWRTDGEEVQQRGLLVEVTPQDVHSGAEVCTMIYAWGPHRFTVTFPTAGTATIRVAGRRLIQGGETRSEPVWAERRIVVR